MKNLINCGCGGSIEENHESWYCDACSTSIPLVLSGRQITQIEALNLFNNQYVSMPNFVSKAGNNFGAVVYISEGKLKFNFL